MIQRSVLVETRSWGLRSTESPDDCESCSWKMGFPEVTMNGIRQNAYSTVDPMK